MKHAQTLAAVVMIALFAACGDKPGPAPKKTPQPPAAATPTAAQLTRLAAADKKDGTEDKVVSKCLTCGLGMAGKADLPVKYGEYTLHLCSAACQAKVAKDPGAAIDAAKVD